MVTVFLIFQFLGLISSVNAILKARTAQGAIAWVVSLNTFSILAVPAYWIFGHSKFEGYVEAHRSSLINVRKEFENVGHALEPFIEEPEQNFPAYEAIKTLAEFPFLGGNGVDLLVDGEATFDSIYQGIVEAENYVLFQFYILRADDIGNKFKSLMFQKADEGVTIYILYDEYGSSDLPSSWIAELQKRQIQVLPFNTRDGMKNPFQINFRNHRKIVVVDGHSTWVGGLNIGDDYLHQYPKLSPWRDTHLKIKGPATLKAQYTFLNDWYWASKTLLSDLSWEPFKPDAAEARFHGFDKKVLLISSGPADALETSSLFYTQAINSAQKRIWIATPYFIPDDATMNALRLAILKKLDVRIITPKLNDNWFVDNAAKVYLSKLASMGAKIYTFEAGFLHQKVMLIDDKAAVVGTVNFDNRSFRLNFEISAVVADPKFAKSVEDMLLNDIGNSTDVSNYQLTEQNIWTRLKAHGCALMSPLL
ncbi:cardiolipin synthase [Marinicella rhabdoformis]|uniref:cardiolipin synthase n=1 Tax=Marinicella rhabdoformis TaxID=2580566 RepID=UPI0012AECDE4|nr:cardiolipin synthase [Marinicella rhabdoformis]